MRAIKEMDYGNKINDLNIYGSHQTEIDDDLKNVFNAFPGLYFLPPYFWYTLLKKGHQKFSEKLFDTHNNSHLMWNQMAFQSFKKTLGEIL